MERALSQVLVGRESELGTLEDILLSASRADARVALVGGDAGMGKTRLSQEVIARARKIGFEVLTGACSEADLSLPYLPFVEAIGNYLAHADLEELRARLGPSALELGRLFPKLAGGGRSEDAGDPAYARLRLCEALVDLLNVPAERRGLLLVLEDLHWADASTREVLDFLVRRLQTGRVMILGTYRSDEMHRKHPLLPTLQGWRRAGLVEVVQLEPLAAAGVGDMVRAIFDQQSVTSEFQDFLHGRCEGNPFVLEEMLKLAIDNGDIYRTDRGWERKALKELMLPRTVKDTILMRVERLDEKQVQLLGTAAVLGHSFESALLIAASGQPEELVEDTLQAAQQQQILEEDALAGRYRFRHALTREVIYEDLPAPKRERLHLRAAAALRNRHDAPTVDIVWHLMAAHSFVEALPLCLRAARDAFGIAAYEEAADLFRRALPHITDRRERAEVCCALGTASSRGGDVAAAIDYFVEGIDQLEQLGDPITAARHRIGLGRARGLHGEGGREGDELEIAARTLEPAGPSEALAEVYMRIGAIHGFNYEYEEGLRMAEKASAMAGTVGADSIRIWNYNYIGLALIGLGRTDEGFQSLWRSYDEAVARDLRWIAGNALHNINAMLQWSWEARALEGLANLPKLRDLRVGVWSVTSPLLSEAMIGYFAGDLLRSVPGALKAIEVGRAVENLFVVRYAEIMLSVMYTDMGRTDEALPLLAMTHAERQRDSLEAAAIIRHSLATGDTAACLEAARFLLKADEGATGNGFAADLGVEGLTAAGQIDEARALFKGFGNVPWQLDTPWGLRSGARVKLAEGNAGEALEGALSAAASFHRAGYRLEEARTMLLVAECAAGGTTQAEEALREAAAIATATGADAIRVKAETLMRDRGIAFEQAPLGPVQASEREVPGERFVTVLFADVRGYTALASELAPSELADRISAFQRWAGAEVERHHGVVDKFAGDALMATFNVSGATVDHGLHALQAALAIRDKAAILGLPVGVGIATGSAVVGRMARGANLSVLGEATNLASRLQGQAEAGEILLSEESGRRVQGWLADRGLAMEPARLQLKGIDGDTPAVRIPAPAAALTAQTSA